MATAVASGAEIAWSLLATGVVLGKVTMSGHEESVRKARAFVRATLGTDHPLVDDARLLISELVTNALQHSDSGRPGGHVTLVVLDVPGGVRVEVTDEGSSRNVPVVRGGACAFGTSGRGLLLVQSLAADWGYVRSPDATTVWFRLLVSDQG